MENPAVKLWVWQWWVSNQRQVEYFHCAKCMKVHSITCGLRLKTPEVLWGEKKTKTRHCFYVETIQKFRFSVYKPCDSYPQAHTNTNHSPTHWQTTVLLTILNKCLVSMSLEVNGVVCDKSPLFFLGKLVPLDQNLIFPYSSNWYIWTG